MGLKNTIMELENNPLSFHSQSIYGKVKYHKIHKSNYSEKIILKMDEKISLSSFKKFAWASLEKRCHCDYDCCGHWFTSSMDIKRVSKNKFSINMTYAQNY